MKINFTIEGKPFGKQRPRFSRRGKFTTTYTPQKTMEYEQLAKMKCYEAMDVFEGWFNDEPLYVNIYAYYEIPKSYSKAKVQLIGAGRLSPTKKPDWDNIGKIVCDSLNGVAYKDDSQIVSGSVYKAYSPSPRVEVEIGEIKLEEK